MKNVYTDILGIKDYEKLLEILQAGYRVGTVYKDRFNRPYFHTNISADEKYIYWSNYGSSANKATARDMQFVIETIFKTELKELANSFTYAILFCCRPITRSINK